jgi:CheY-like chemotaxis protein
MTSTTRPSERRILVIDDNVAIHRDFRKLLSPEGEEGQLDQIEEVLFGSIAPPPSKALPFVVDSVTQGKEGLEAVRRMRKLGRPYALMFVDMRMPPGWDGVETLERIWYESPDIEGVICSAYSDYSWHDMIRRLKRPGLRLLNKPFASKDLLEFAWSLTSRWLAMNRR